MFNVNETKSCLKLHCFNYSYNVYDWYLRVRPHKYYHPPSSFLPDCHEFLDFGWTYPIYFS